MTDISIGPRTFCTPSAARRAALRELGKPDAQPGEDFIVEPVGGRYALTMKMPEKIAKGPTGIARQFKPIDPSRIKRLQSTAVASAKRPPKK